MRPLSLRTVAAVVVFSAMALSGSAWGQHARLPSGRLEFRTGSVEFRPDGTFTIETRLDGLGTLRFGGNWTTEPHLVTFGVFKVEAGADYLEQSRIPMTGCS